MISNERVKHVFSGNGARKKFQIPFDFFQNTAGVFDKNNQISVILTDATGTETTLVEDIDYEVETHDPSDSGSSGYSGYVTLNTAPAVGEKLTIMRDVPLVQELDLEAGQEIGPVELEAALDKVVMTLQQLNEKLQRAICYNPSTTDNQVDAEAYIANLQALFTDGAAAVSAATATAVSACEGYASTASTKAAQATAAFEDTVNRMVTAISASNTAVSAKEAAVDAKNDAVSAKNAAVSAKTAAETAQTAAETAATNVSTAISTHNQSDSAHSDIRTAVAAKQDALPSGTTGYYLKKTTDGVEWAAGTGSVTVDDALSDSSTNPVQNKVIKAALDGKQKTLIAGTNISIDDDGTISATGGGGGGTVDVDGSLSPTSTNPVQNKAIYNAIAAKQDALSAAQLLAANSGATATKVSGYDTHVEDGDVHVTSSQKTAWTAKQDAISDLATIRSNATAGAGAATIIATYGNIVTHDADEFQAAGNYAAASHTHTKSQITDLPTIPSKTSQLTNDAGFISSVPAAGANTLGGVKLSYDSSTETLTISTN